MRILTVSYSDSMGGASRSAYRLHRALKDIGLNSFMLVSHKNCEDKDVILAHDSFFLRFVGRLKASFERRIFIGNKYTSPFSLNFISSPLFVNKINNLKPDIVHLHWINNSLLSIADLKNIKAPIVWSLHDSWPFTGGCHLPGKCTRYAEMCGSCPLLSSNNSNNLSRLVMLKKKHNFSLIQSFTIVGLSSWLTDCAKRAFIFKNRRIVNLPNCISVKEFHKNSQDFARKKLNLPLNKNLVLFGANHLSQDRNKGIDLISKMLSEDTISDYDIVTFGGDKNGRFLDSRFAVHSFGYVNSADKLRNIYNAVNVCVVPSRQENLSNVIMESLACGTPVAAFDIGGNKDLIKHMKNGYLASAYNTLDLSRGINWILSGGSYNSISHFAVEFVKNNFEERTVAQKYKELYLSILNEEAN